MALTFDGMVVLLVLAPFVAAALAPLLQRLVLSASGWILALVPLAIGAALMPLVPRVASGEVIPASLEWVPALGIRLGFVFDGLSLTFAAMILIIGAMVLVYAAAYLRGYAHQGRFMAFLMLFMGAMLGLVLADDLIALYVFWELTTVASFLLIGFEHGRMAARRAAIQAVVVTTIGGLALLVGVIVIGAGTGNWSLSAVGDLTGSPLYPVVLTAVLLAAFTKSAQVPFHFWLPNAMEAPAPVSAYLHSATMVQGGVYLLLRTSPMLADTAVWTLTLTIFGSVTLIWGAIAALRQTDLKWMLAWTTVASLGLTVVLIGIGTKLAIVAAIAYFVAHAFYKSALFLSVGLIDKETGLRDLTVLGGLRERMAVTFIAAAFAAISMLGLPPAVGYFAKEEIYLALVGGDFSAMVLLMVMVVGNAALGAIALAVVIAPFLGAPVSLPKAPREGPFAMLLAVSVLGALGLIAGWQIGWLSEAILSSAASAVTGSPVQSSIVFSLDPSNPALWLSIVTWVLAYLMYRALGMLRAMARRLQSAPGITFDGAFDWLMFGLIRASAAVTRLLHHGRLELYLVTIFALLAVALIWPLWGLGGVQPLPDLRGLNVLEWGLVLVIVLGILSVLFARTRLVALVSLGVQGTGVAVLFLVLGAPDLGFTQFMVEILSVVILALVMTKLRLEVEDRRFTQDVLRDGTIAVLCGLGVTMLLLAVVRGPFDPRLSDFFAAASYPLAHGHNIVNVILVDFRGLDTLGEISVVMTAGVAVVALLRWRLPPALVAGDPAPAPEKPKAPPRKRTRRARKAPATADSVPESAK